jgi:3-hydroxyisobutyrate dehydrogenase
MGRRVSTRLLEAGNEVVVWNRSAGPAEGLEAAGATVAATPRDAAAAADLVIAMVTDDEVSRAIWFGDDGAIAGLREGSLAVESSTLTPGWARELGAAVAAAGARFADAPVVGTRPQAEAGALLYLAGGAGADVAELAESVGSCASAVRHVGPVGAGTAVKLAVNALFATQLAALAELLAMTRTQGLDPAEVLALLEPTGVMSPIAAAMGKAMLAGEFDPLFPIALVEKDLRYAASAAAEGKAPIADALAAVYAAAREAGFGGDNITGIARLYDPYLDAGVLTR